MYDFPAPRPIQANIRVSAGTLEVYAEELDTVEVTVEPGDASEAAREAAAKTVVELRGENLVVVAPESKGLRFLWRGAKLKVTVRLPLDSTMHVKLAAVDAQLHGRYADVKIHSASSQVYLGEAGRDALVNTASGNVRIDAVGGSLKAHSASGKLQLGNVGGSVVAHSASGNIQIGEVLGEALTNTASGDIQIGPVGGSVKANSASGDIEIASTRSGLVKVNTASGDVRVGVLAGTPVWLDLSTASGRTTSDLNVEPSPVVAGEPQLTLQVRTASGDIEVRRVPAAA